MQLSGRLQRGDRVFPVGVLCQSTEKDYREHRWPGKPQPTKKVAGEETEEGGTFQSQESLEPSACKQTQTAEPRAVHSCLQGTAKDTRKGKLGNCLITSIDSL